MMIKFNNAHPEHRGNVIYINSNHIFAVYEEASEKGGSLATKIFGGGSTIWTVEESLSEVLKKLEKKEV